MILLAVGTEGWRSKNSDSSESGILRLRVWRGEWVGIFVVVHFEAKKHILKVKKYQNSDRCWRIWKEDFKGQKKNAGESEKAP